MRFLIFGILFGIVTISSLFKGDIEASLGSIALCIILISRYRNANKKAKKASSTATIQNECENLQKIVTTHYASPTAHNAYILNLDYIKQCKNCFIAFDVETTGLNPNSNRMIEISAVYFENFIPTKSFSTLINPGCHIPSSATQINGITDAMVADAPNEKAAIDQFCEFVTTDALGGNIVLVAHNAIFDVKFLLHALSRCGIGADISFQDTLYLSRAANLCTDNCKLGTVANYFGIAQNDAHRAADDARVCGEIFVNLLEEREKTHLDKLSGLTEIERETCKWFKRLLEAADLNTQLLTFNASSYLSVNCVYNVIKFKPKAKKPYVLIDRGIQVPNELETAPATKSEGEQLIRVFYKIPSDLNPLSEFILNRYQEVFSLAEKYVADSDKHMKEVAKTIDAQICI